MTETQTTKRVYLKVAILSLFSCVCFLLFFYFLTLLIGLPAYKCLAFQRLNFIYQPKHVFITLLPIQGFEHNFYIYTFICFLIATFFVLLKGKYFKSVRTSRRLKLLTFFVFTIGWIFLISLQTYNQYGLFKLELSYFHGKDINARIERVQKSIYTFAQRCKYLLPGKHRAKIITDYSLGKDYKFIVLSYYLFPIDVRGIYKEKEIDCLIVFDKEVSEKEILKDYNIIYRQTKNRFLAIKKDK